MKGLSSAFSLPEILLTLAVISILSTVSLVLLLTPQNKASIDTTVLTIVSDLKNQQIKSMSGESNESFDHEPFGIHFENNYYVLFQGSSFSYNDPHNFKVDLPKGLLISNINLPTGDIIFEPISGEVIGFNASLNSIVVKNLDNQFQKVLSVNKYGAVFLY